MSENHREPEVPKVKVPVVECLDGIARITLEELAITHFLKNGTLQNACSTSPRVVADLGKSAHSHAHRQVDEQPTKRSKKNDDKSAVAFLKKYELHDRTWKPVVCRVQFIEYTTIGLRLQGYGAAEVALKFTEELRHAETNPTCTIHESCCTSR